MDQNKKWMATGAVGCTFAALFAKNPERVGWKTIINPERFEIPAGAIILSLQFPDKNKEQVIEWALANGFYTEEVEAGRIGLRYNIGNKVAWVQYFGLDSHVKTRQAPVAELMLCVKVPMGAYFKVAGENILHLAHASVASLSKLKADKLWQTSHLNTAKRLGHKPTIDEASKTTFLKW